MPDIVIAMPDTAPQHAQVAPLVARAQALEVVDGESRAAALELVQRARSLRRQFVEFLGPLRRSTRDAAQAALVLERRLTGPCDEADRVAAAKCAAWDEAELWRQRAARIEAERVARAAAEEQLLAEAQHAQDTGDMLAAEEILAQPVEVVVAPVAPPPTPDGVSTRRTWRAEVVDLAALVRYVAANPAAISYVEACGPALNALARANRGLAMPPGVRAFEVFGYAAREPSRNVADHDGSEP